MEKSLTRANQRLSLTKQHLQPNRCNSSVSINSITSINQGTKYTPDFKNYAINSQTNKVISYFHDVPLNLNLQDKTVNMIVEIPRWSNAKFEISPNLLGNPIIQDTKKGKVRFVKNLFPYHGYIHNYGALSQTWEDPTTENKQLGLFGDNDPIDVCEIGATIHKTGEIIKVKILGSIALIDDGELDWKIIAIDVNDPLSNELNDIQDVSTKCPGLLESTRQWFKDYKKPDGKPENKFAFDGIYQDQKETLHVIQECNSSWKRLLNCEVKGDDLPLIDNVSIVNLPGFIEGGFPNNELLTNESKPAAPIPEEVSRSYYY